ncbi:hypothetical protein AHF37_04443 [Paragonimus kellicotti]|nr:hypothetical protein AHF37_04443 [Paragonimus kellicotti]
MSNLTLPELITRHPDGYHLTMNKKKPSACPMVHQTSSNDPLKNTHIKSDTHGSGFEILNQYAHVSYTSRPNNSLELELLLEHGRKIKQVFDSCGSCAAFDSSILSGILIIPSSVKKKRGVTG